MSLKLIGAALAALVLTACNPPARSSLSPVEGDSFLGNTASAVTVVEYGAPTCPGCKAWHDQFWAKLKTAFVDTNKIKFIFREFPSHNPPVDAAIFSMARCVGGDYFALIDEAFARQRDIETASRSADGPMKQLESLGAKFQLSPTQVHSCIDDPKMHQRIFDVQEQGAAQGVDSTPTFFINNKLMEDPTFDSMSAQINTLLGTPTPAPPAPAPAPTPAAPVPKSPAAPSSPPGH
jgi:protein-disulfide isomerase